MPGHSLGFAGVVRRRVVLASTLDALGIAAAVALASDAVGRSLRDAVLLLLICTSVRLCSLAATQVYRSSWYLFCFRDAVRVTQAWAGATVLVLLGWWWVGGWTHWADLFRALAIETTCGYLILCGMRSFARALTESRSISKESIIQGPKKRAIVVGAGAAALMVIRELGQNAAMNYEVVGLVDDDRRKWGVYLEGVRVHGGTDAIEHVARICDADCIVLAMPSVRGARIAEILRDCQKPGIPVYTVPGLGELLTGQVQVSKIRPLKVEDLLGRSPNEIGSEHWDEVSHCFSGKTILVTGAGGSIGSELCRQLACLSPSALVMVENNENNLFEINLEMQNALGDRAQPELIDIREKSRLAAVFEKYRPQAVFHAAAFKHVPMMERHPRDAIANNVGGTQNLAELAHEFGVAHFVQISTDKAVNPTNVMGATKRVAEMIVQSLAVHSPTKFSCVRFGNVLGSRGSVIHTFRRQIEAGGPVTVTDPEVTRFFMTIPEAVSLVIQAGARGQGGEIFLLDMGKPVKIVDLARSMIRLSGRSESEVPIEFVGLRPGEKLYEELLLSGEGVKPSGMDKIHLATCAGVEPVKLRELTELLLKTAQSGDERQIRSILVGAGIGFRPGMAAQEEDRTALAAKGATSLSRGSLDRNQVEIPEAGNQEDRPSEKNLRRVS